MKQSFSVLHLTVGAEPFWLSASCIYQWKHKMLIVRHWRDECDSCWVNPTTLLGHVVHTITLYPSDPSSPLTKAEHSEGGQKCLSSEREWRATKRRRKGGKQCESRLPPRQEQSGQKYRNTSSPIIFSTCVNLKGEKKRIKNSKGWKEEGGENKSRGAEVMCYQQRAFQRTVLSQMRRWCVWACGFATQQRQGWCVCKVNPPHLQIPNTIYWDLAWGFASHGEDQELADILLNTMAQVRRDSLINTHKAIHAF